MQILYPCISNRFNQFPPRFSGIHIFLIYRYMKNHLACKAQSICLWKRGNEKATEALIPLGKHRKDLNNARENSTKDREGKIWKYTRGIDEKIHMAKSNGITKWQITWWGNPYAARLCKQCIKVKRSQWQRQRRIDSPQFLDTLVQLVMTEIAMQTCVSFTHTHTRNTEKKREEKKNVEKITSQTLASAQN